MFGKSIGTGPSGQSGKSDPRGQAPASYLDMAEDARKKGDLALAAHLYVAAFEAANDSPAQEAAYADALRKAWEAACELKERALAEYVFDKLEPFSSPEEMAQRAHELQGMALSKLEEFGLSKDDLGSMARLFSGELGGPGMAHAGPAPAALMAALGGLRTEEAEQGTSDDSSDEGPGSGGSSEPFRYADLIGYDRAIEHMNGMGVGLADDARFSEFVSMLRQRHGIDSVPSYETLVFRASSREDATRFMVATAGELRVPVMRMRMGETPQGNAVLYMMASPEFRDPSRWEAGEFEGRSALVLEDIDYWDIPDVELLEDPEAPVQLARGVRETVNFIRFAVENPDVTVLASVGDDVPFEGFFADLLDPIRQVDVAPPDRGERAAVWQHVCAMHPSVRFLDREELVAYSAGMSREDIYAAARQAVEQSYRKSIESRRYVSVSRDNMFEKLAAYHDLDSKEYRALEDAMVASLRSEIERSGADLLDDANEKDGL